MQLYFASRAIKHDIDRFIEDLQAQYFDFEYEIDGKKQRGALQLGVRPIQLYELAFPEPALDHVVAMLEPFTEYPKLNKFIKLIRKVLGLKPIPASNPQIPKRITWRTVKPDIRLIPIGYKNDNFGEAMANHQTGKTYKGEQI